VDGKWKFIYSVNTPIEITDKIQKNIIDDEQLVFVVYEFISDLKIKNKIDVHDKSVNLEFQTLDQYLQLLDAQRKADLDYRKKWIQKYIEEHDGEEPEPHTITLSNKDFTYNELHGDENNIRYISSVIEQKDDETIFAGI
jgi:hypothetical protein